MLIDFRVENFRAFRDEQELNMRRAKRAFSGHEGSGWDRKISPVAAIYGPNASGKSTLFSALDYVRGAVSESYRLWPVDGGTKSTPFLLSRSFGKESSFAIEFKTNETEHEVVDYHYGFSVDGEIVTEEWLHVYRTANRTILFERERDQIHFGSSFRGDRKLLLEAAEQRPNALTLSVGGQLGYGLLMPAFRWITQSILPLNAPEGKDNHQRVIRSMRNDSNYKRRFTQFLTHADLGVCDIEILERPVDEETVQSIVKEISVSESVVRRYLQETNASLALKHLDEDGTAISFPMALESHGTRATIALLDVALHALEDGSVAVIDEIDTSLHPLLVSELVELFIRPDSNPRQAQLIFTTHDVTLLSNEASMSWRIERDQVWITEKAYDGSASLTALSEYQRYSRSENLERGYLSGRFGGLPNIRIRDVAMIPPDDIAGGDRATF